MHRRLLVLLLLGCVVTAALIYWQWPTQRGPRKPDELIPIALNESASVDDRERAILALAKSDPENGKARLREILAKAKSTEARCAAITALAEASDLESMPQMIALLSDGSEAVRHRANLACVQILGRNFGYDATAPVDVRNRTIAAIRKDYELMKQNPHPKYKS